MSSSSGPLRLWHPRYWGMWFGLGVFRLLSALPWSLQRKIAALLAPVFFYLIPIRRRVAEINLQLCFPDLSSAERRRIVRAHYDSLALGLFETCVAWWRPKDRLPRHRIAGLEHLENARAAGRGVLLLTGHFTTLELCARFLNERVRIGAIYRDPNNPVIARIMRRNRDNKVTVGVHFDDIRALLHALREGHALWYAPDQGRQTKLSELVPFFGEPAVTTTATSRLAKTTGAAVVPFFSRREPDGEYRLTILPALDNFPTEDAVADALRINRLIEEHVRTAPEQYLWIHKRFKRRGPDLSDAYARPASGRAMTKSE